MDVTPRSSALAQWASIVVAPVVYLTNLSLAYALVPPACDSQHDIAVHLANGVTLLLMLVALGLAWRARTASPRPPAVADDDVSRDHFLATIGVCRLRVARACRRRAMGRAVGPVAVLRLTAQPDTLTICAALAVTGGAYVVGVARLWRASAVGRGIRRRDAAAFAGGWLSLAAALLGPLDEAVEGSFAAHMIQHEILMLVAAPLLVNGRPLAAWTWLLPQRTHAAVRSALASPARSAVWRACTTPLGATLLQLSLLYVLHVPSIFDHAVTHPAAHAAQHVAFLASALCFWWAMGGAHTLRRGALSGASLACLFVTMLGTGALGAFLTFASAPWYAIYARADALEDQQLGGLLMWIPGGTVYLAAALLRARDLLVRSAAPGTGAALVAAPKVTP